MSIYDFVENANCNGDEIRVVDEDGNTKYQGSVKDFPYHAEWADKGVDAWTVNIENSRYGGKQAVIEIMYFNH